VTPTQLRAFATVVRLGSVKAAAEDLAVTEAAVSLHVGQLRKELGDQLFNRTGSGLAFTPGGLRLASRAVELLGLQDRTVLEVREAGAGRRLLRLAAASLFSEHAAPGLIGLFADRAKDLDVELSSRRSSDFEQLLVTRTVDATIGPRPAGAAAGAAGGAAGGDGLLRSVLFLNYQVWAVAAPDHPIHRASAAPNVLRDQVWVLGPSAAEDAGIVPAMLHRIGVPESRQQIFQSHAAALDEAKRGRGIALALSFAAQPDVSRGALVPIPGRLTQAQGSWHITVLAGGQATPAAEEMARFVTTPRATQAMLRGRAVVHGRFKPAVHVTLWS
jgi:LysR family transcriptional regulator, low CO2-responsive transcriptional regulator